MLPVNEFLGTHRYELRGVIGRGGMGVVYKAYDRERDTFVALKTIREIDPSSLYHFKNEFRSLAELVHPNLLPLYELVSDGEHWFFTMELAEDAVDFYTHVRAIKSADAIATEEFDGKLSVESSDPTRRQDNATSPDVTHRMNMTSAASEDTQEGHDDTQSGHENDSDDTFNCDAPVETPAPRLAPLSADVYDRLRASMRQLVDGVCALHDAGKLHRDLKPANVFVRSTGRVVLLDFGLVAELANEPSPESNEPSSLKAAHESSAPSHQSISGRITGTAKYMAPEQAAAGRLTTSTDWYAVGVMLFQAITGQLPFDGPRNAVLRDKQTRDAPAPSEIMQGVPEDLDSLCVDLLQRDPKNRPSGIEIAARLAPENPPTAVAAEISGPIELPFVGRADHLNGLDDAFKRTQQGSTTVVRVHGRSGAGKSALVQHFLERIQLAPDTVVLAGRCYEQESVPYKAVDSLVDALARYLMQLPEEEVVTWLPESIAALARIFPVLQRVDAVARADTRTAEIPDLRELRRRAFGALGQLLREIGQRCDLVLSIDDLQWGDVDSANLLAELLQPVDAPKMLVVLSYRSEYIVSSPCLIALDEQANPMMQQSVMPVEELTATETRSLAEELLRDASPTMRASIDWIVEESHGSPLFVYELVTYVSAGGDLGSDASELNLDDVLWDRIKGLPEPSRKLLEVISVAGQPTPICDAHRAAGSDLPLIKALRDLRGGRLIRSTGPRLIDQVETFHDRIRESVVLHLPSLERKNCHASLAESLRQSDNADTETIAVHLHKSDQYEEAAKFYAAAADESARALAFDRAANLYRLSLTTHAPKGETACALYTKYGDTLANAGRPHPSASQYLIAAELTDGLPRIDLERKAAYQLCAGGHLDEGREVLDRVLKRVGMQLPNSQKKALSLLLWRRLKLRLRGTRFDAESAITAAQRAKINVTWSASAGMGTKNIVVSPAFQTLNLLLSLKSGDQFSIARALCWEATYTAHDGIGAMRYSRKLIDEAAEIAAQLELPYINAMVELAEGACGFLTGRWRTGSTRCDRAISILKDRCTGTSWEIGQAATYMLWCMSWEGRFGEMSERSSEILEDVLDRGDLTTAANLHSYMTPLSHLTDGDVGAARESLAESLSKWSRKEYNIQNMTALMGGASVHLYAGEYDSAHARMVNEWGELKRSLILQAQICSVVLPELRVRSALGSYVHLRQDPSLLQDAKKYLRKMERKHIPYSVAMAAPLRASVSYIDGDRSRALSQLREGIELLERQDMNLFAAASRFRYGQLLGPGNGEAHQAEAIEWMNSVGIRDPLAMITAYTPAFPKI
ncbi:serine/threonine protein kinase [Rhodopirellula rubra]|uniref:Serine/threonine protein kinase n=1 Tax=Aporhodopirellula rubra TaxID=980271 RepID=A0A7W5E5W1_9BACT|nr:serine/threonine-protein kinase [Aporhodopirellula rubra]MBB3210304.1 serine/threonine protein kinase [Aporhodopirellula rubra]